jgi:hypothetical protein
MSTLLKELKSFVFLKDNKSQQKGLNIYFVRYENHYIIGIKGSLSFVKEVRAKIDLYIKTNLYLEIMNFSFVNSKESFIKFFGFRIYLRIHKFLNNNYKENIYRSVRSKKRRIFNRLQHIESRLAQASVVAIKHDFLQIIRERLENLHLK